jgi:hypothetical protein
MATRNAVSADTIDSVAVRAYTIPTDAPEADGTLSWDSTTMVLAEVGAAGARGIGWTYGPSACASVITDVLAGVVRGRSPLDVTGSSDAMIKAVRNLTRQGVVGYAISSLFFDGALDPAGGVIRPDPGAPGLGLTLRVADAEPYRVR